MFVPVNFRLAEPELRAVLNGSGAVTLVCEEGHREIADTVRGETGLRRFLLVDDDREVPTQGATEGATEGADGWEPWSPLIAAAHPTPSVVDKHAAVINALLKNEQLGASMRLDWEMVREVVASEDGMPIEIAQPQEAVASQDSVPLEI